MTGARTRCTAQSWEFAGNRRPNQRTYDNEARGKGQRKHVPWGYDKSTYNQATTYFFTNFPEDWNHAEMWETFKRFGRLDQIRIRNCKLWVNKARFSKEESRKKPMLNVNTAKVKPGMLSYADALTGTRGTKSKSEAGQSTRTRAGKEKIWKEMRREDGTGLEFNTKKEDCAWIEGCYVGIVHSIEAIPSLQEKFYLEDHFSISVKPMGGKMVLLYSSDKDELKNIVEFNEKWLNQWFKELRSWNPGIIANERFAWMRCQGVPLEAWGEDFFATIAHIWGKFICLDDSTNGKERLDIGRFLISTRAMETISKKLQIKVDGRIENLKINEEESANGIFGMKTNFIPCFSSDSTMDDEVWSLGCSDEMIMEDVPLKATQYNVLPNDSLHKEDDDVARRNEVGEETGEANHVQLNSKEMENEIGKLEDQMDKDLGRSSKIKRTKKARSCASVYRATSIISLAFGKKGKNRRNQRNPGQMRIVPTFHANKDNSVAGQSIRDSGIANCNRDRSTQVAPDEALRT
ncbi:hypothetical protein SLEP1_g4713 [Rubroshorea leprosula]|uniref:DUF4283 domain-containing protein n=1 Tax=Rubroshorea leprosula TaxID=152421 RepID=A0AAV5HVZ7_9ROSI|nr:hypothetical protein SLEP1_g4713 [Rubroshorea leprosula]